jgi:alpha-L-fucosidase
MVFDQSLRGQAVFPHPFVGSCFDEPVADGEVSESDGRKGLIHVWGVGKIKAKLEKITLQGFKPLQGLLLKTKFDHSKNRFMRKLSVIILFILSPILCIIAQNTPSTPDNIQRMQWFQDAKLGIFIHWGVYAVNGIDESWSFYNEYLPYEEYMKQLQGFTASNYDPDLWADLIRESGAKYAVLTSKHHDGVALWETRQGDLSVARQTPAGRDLVGPYCEALRAKGIRVGLYYSLLDWSHTDYPNFTKSQKRYTEDSIRWNRFMDFNLGQISEISALYNPDLVWFDGDWEQSAEKWRAPEIRQLLLNHNPGVIINSRLQGYGDYATPEQGIPVVSPKDDYWELCMTTNNSWGYQPNDMNYKPINLIIRIFADVIGMGGNLLLDIGPKPDGTIPEEQAAILKGLGRWTHKHSEAIYGTHAGLPKDCYYGPSTLSADSTILYLFIPNSGFRTPDSKTQVPITGQSGNSKSQAVNSNQNSNPKLQSTNRQNSKTSLSPTVLPSYRPTILLKGVTNNIATVWVVGNGTKLEQKTWLKPWWSGNPGLVSISVPEEALDQEMTVVAVQLEGKLMIKF